jgi:hypothetical protein
LKTTRFKGAVEHLHSLGSIQTEMAWLIGIGGSPAPIEAHPDGLSRPSPRPCRCT